LTGGVGRGYETLLLIFRVLLKPQGGRVKPTVVAAVVLSLALMPDASGVRAESVGSISGSVKSDSGEPLAGICIGVYDISGAPVGWASTDAGGVYRVGRLSDGDYKVSFDCSLAYFSEWYDDKPTFETANLVSVVAGGETTGIDAALRRSGSISGVVTDERGQPMFQTVWIDAYTKGHYASSGWTDEAGAYRVEGLETGTYKVFFDTCCTYVPEWYNDKAGPYDASGLETADPISVTAGVDTGGINAALASAVPANLAISRISVINRSYGQFSSPSVAETRWVEVDVLNHTVAPAHGAMLSVQVCPVTTGSLACQIVGSVELDVAPYCHEVRTFEWNTLGTVGDVTVEAQVDLDEDPDPSDNVASIGDSVLVGGTGIGVGPP
jgi:hypothetical protein